MVDDENDEYTPDESAYVSIQKNKDPKKKKFKRIYI